MSSRSGGKVIPSAFDTPQEVGDSPREWDQAIYGKLGDIDKSRIVAEGRPIKDIFPDPKQPRRTIPSAVRLACRVEPGNMQTVFKKWVQMAEKECGLNLSMRVIQGMVEGTLDPEDPEALPEGMTEANTPITVSLVKAINLAASIKKDTLTNAITVVRQGRQYIINTGERRWLAYHLLAWLYGSQWEQIPAHETPANIWKQASENLSREDLGGIALARQFALLVMACYPDIDWDVDFDAEAVCDREYYAQVADGNEWRIPRGMGAQIAGAMGVGETLLRRYRAILSIPDEVWLKADDENWSAHSIYDWITENNRVEKESHTVTAVTVSRKNTPAPVPSNNGSNLDIEAIDRDFLSSLEEASGTRAPASASTPKNPFRWENIPDLVPPTNSAYFQWVWNLYAQLEAGQSIQLPIGWNVISTSWGGRTPSPTISTNTGHEVYKPLHQPMPSPDLPPGYTTANLDKGGDAAILPGGYARKLAIENGMTMLWQGMNKLQECHSAEMMNELTSADRLETMGMLTKTISRAMGLWSQLAEMEGVNAVDQFEKLCQEYGVMTDLVDWAETIVNTETSMGDEEEVS